MQLSPSSLSFEDCFKPKTSWMDYEGVNVQATLISHYSDFYDLNTQNLIPVALCRRLQNLNCVDKKISREDKKAVELFKELSRFPYTNARARSCIEHPDLQRIISEFGSRILAHGVEEAKGGICNLLMMALSGKVLIPTAYWGPLTPGPANISPLCHGPFFVVHSIDAETTGKELRNKQPFESIDCILLPFEEVKVEVLKLVQKLLDIGLFDSTVANTFESKLKTYDEYYQELLLHHRPQALIISSSPRSPTKNDNEKEEKKRKTKGGETDTLDSEPVSKKPRLDEL